MSLILKGIDLPDKRDMICLEIYSDGSVWDRSNWEPHPPKVSAIQIPTPHGRLIDADYIKALYYEFSPPEEDAPEGVMAEVTELFDMRALDEAPTILEEEE